MDVGALRSQLVNTAIFYRADGWQDAEDVAHDVIEKALRGQGLDHPSPYWHVAVRNMVADKRRALRPTVPLLDIAELPVDVPIEDHRLQPVKETLGVNYEWLLRYHGKEAGLVQPVRYTSHDRVRAHRLRVKARCGGS